MNIRDTRELKAAAVRRLRDAQEERKIVLIFGAFLALSSLLVTVVNYWLGLEIDKTGGLSNFGTRSVLATIQTLLPIIQTAAVMCLELGYVAAMLRVGRGQYVSPRTLKAGVQRFGALIRATLFQGLLYLVVGIGSFYLSMQVFMITPLSNRFMQTLLPYLSGITEQELVALLADEALQMQLMADMIPLYVLVVAVFLAVAVPMAYRYRMVKYVLLDKPGIGALAALRESRAMMRGNRLKLFRLDVSMWWYYGVSVLASVVCYGDVFLNMLGITLPWPGIVSYFLFYVLYLAVMLASCLLLRNRVEVTYALAYDAVRPKEEKGSGVVLGNIFQM